MSGVSRRLPGTQPAVGCVPPVPDGPRPHPPPDEPLPAVGNTLVELERLVELHGGGQQRCVMQLHEHEPAGITPAGRQPVGRADAAVGRRVELSGPHGSTGCDQRSPSPAHHRRANQRRPRSHPPGLSPQPDQPTASHDIPRPPTGRSGVRQHGHQPAAHREVSMPLDDGRDARPSSRMGSQVATLGLARARASMPGVASWDTWTVQAVVPMS